MNREQERIRKNLEKNPVAECNKIQKKSRKFNDEQIVENLYSFLGERKIYNNHTSKKSEQPGTAPGRYFTDYNKSRKTKQNEKRR